LKNKKVDVFWDTVYPYCSFCLMSAFANAVVTREIKLFPNYFSLRRCPNWNDFA